MCRTMVGTRNSLYPASANGGCGSIIASSRPQTNISGRGRVIHYTVMYIQQVSAFLDSHWARNQILRTAQFAAAMVSGLLESASPDAASKLIAVSSKISGVRVILRLMDDIPTLVYNLSSIKREGSLPKRTADVLLFLVNQLYYPVEHIAWTADQGLLPVQSSRFWLLSNILWMASLIISLVQTLVALSTHIYRLRAVRKADDVTSRQVALRRQLLQTSASAVQLLADLMLAVHWMPSGFPGAGCLGNLGMGFFGLMSSLIGLYKMALSSKS